ncbi:MAG: alpha/beta hydrolase [Candidatus Eiseniibacteriota bacterium]
MATTILDHSLIAERYFFPDRQRLTGDGTRRIELPGATLACYHHAPLAGALTVVHFHGNAEIVADHVGPIMEAFEAIGLNVFFAEYRGYGDSTGTPALGTMLDDVPALLDATGIPTARMLLFGRSVGSLFALRAASCRPQAAGLVLESAIADPLERILMRVTPEELGRSRAELAEVAKCLLDHERILRGFERPVLVLHTRHDGLVDVDNARRLHDWAAGPSRLRIFESGDHSTILRANHEAYFEELERFVRDLCEPGD